MKRTLAALLACACLCPALMADTLLISFNARDGFRARQDTARMDAASRWLKSRAPGLTAFQELRGFTPEALSAYAKTYGHSHAVLSDGSNPVGLTADVPVTAVRTSLPGVPAFLHAQAAGFDILCLRLSPGAAALRLSEARAVRDYLRSNGSRSWVVAGDFNALSPFDRDWLEEHRPDVLKAAEATAEAVPHVPAERGFEVAPFADMAVMHTFYSVPLMDPVRAGIPAGRRLSAPEGSPAFYSVRTAGILLSDRLMQPLPAVWQWKGSETAGLSDRFPIGVLLPKAR